MAARRELPPTDAAKEALIAHGAVQTGEEAAPAPETDAAETAADASADGRVSEEPQEPAKSRQRAPQRRPGGPAAKPAPPPVEPDPIAPDDEPELPVLTREQEARWELWLQSAAGKARKTREAAADALAAFEATVVEARAAGVSEWSIQAAALRGRLEAPPPSEA